MKFEPISYDHAARLIGKSPWEVSRSADLLAAAHLKAMETYGCDACVVGLDIYNVEIEAYGCTIQDPGGTGVPIAEDPVFDRVEEFLSLEFDPATAGRIPMVFKAAEMIAQQKPRAKIRIPLSGPFTIACHLLGMENMICELFTDPEPTMAALMHLAKNQLRFGQLAIEKGFGVSLFESSVTPPLLSPELFSERVRPALATIMDGVPDAQLIIGGDTLPILDAILSLSPAYIICPIETDQETFMDRVAFQSQETTVRVNMSPSVFLPGNRAAALAEAKRAGGLAARRENTSVGSLIPFEADPGIIQEVSSFAKTSQAV